jgi:hypothetical protein
MVKDIEPLPLGSATATARLCNFPTGHSSLLLSHKTWLTETAIKVIEKSPNPWVDLFGYASHLGNPVFNRQLSFRRCEEVVKFIKASAPKASFPQEFGFGDSKSAGDAKNDDGLWRAVDVYVYAHGKPPPPPPPPPQIVDEWFVTEFSGRSESVVVVLGYAAFEGHITFERADGTKYRGAIGAFGLSAGISLDLGKMPGLSKLLARFPALAKFLGGGGDLANDLLQKVMQPGLLQRLIARTPGGMAIYNALLKLSTGGAVAPGWAPSAAIGMVFPFKPPLSTTSFYGSCMIYSLTGTVLIANGGVYLLFFGYRGDMYSTSFSMDNFNGFAIISAVGAQVQIPGLGAGGTLYLGEIT